LSSTTIGEGEEELRRGLRKLRRPVAIAQGCKVPQYTSKKREKKGKRTDFFAAGCLGREYGREAAERAAERRGWERTAPLMVAERKTMQYKDSTATHLP
jgi:hypothetical protein